MYSVVVETKNTINLQQTLAASSAVAPPIYHHPISCRSELRLEENGALCCEHNCVLPEDRRTQTCLNHSISILLIEEAMKL